MKSGPTLRGCTRRPRSFRAARSASVTVVFPTPLCVPAMTSLGKFIPCANLIGKLHSGKNRSDRRAKEEHLLVVLIEEVINTTKNLPLFRHIIGRGRSEEHTSELQSRLHLVCRLLLEKKKHQRPEVPRSLRNRRD